MTTARRTFVLSAAAAALSPRLARAQTWPARPVRIVSPFPPAGSADSTARALAERLAQKLGTGFFIENRPGAGGGLGADIAAKAPPDGYTIVIGAAGAMAINKTLYRQLPYDPQRDFTPITLVGYTPVLLVAHPGAPAKTVAELIAAAKASPGTLTYASNGNGTAHHLTGELFQERAGISMTHVPYNGTVNAVKDVISGLVPYGFLDLTLCLPLMQAGRLRGIATSGAKRSAAAPDLPTIAESGLRGFDAVGWFGLFGPRGLPSAIVERLNAAVKEIVAEPAFQTIALNLAVDLRASTPAELAAYQADEIEKWAKIVRAAKVTLD